jgi:hypothetical protein
MASFPKNMRSLQAMDSAALTALLNAPGALIAQVFTLDGNVPFRQAAFRVLAERGDNRALYRMEASAPQTAYWGGR